MERQRERQRQLRTQQIRRYSLIGGVALVVIVAIVLISVFAFHVGGSPSKGGHTLAAPTFTLGEFFDVWGQPMSATKMGSYTANSQHKLVYEVFDANGKLSTATTDLRQIALGAHETIVIHYNNPNVHPTT